MFHTICRLDSSNIYGSSLESERSLRNNEPDGLLDFAVLPRFRQGGYPSEILPRARAPLGDECTDPRTGRFCFHAGDLRSNEMIGLTATHTIWLREHNRVARKLKNLNPTFTRDQIFHEARRIVNAQYQHIIYNEWLPIVIGKQYMDTYGITPMSSGYFNRYDEDIDPRISNEFSAAAFRMGHTLIQGLIQ
jgi:peroxidase